MKYERWNIAPAPDGAAQALMEDGYPYLLSLVLASRGVTCAQEAAEFLDRERELSISPMDMMDMDKAVERIQRAVEAGSTSPSLATMTWTASPPPVCSPTTSGPSARTASAISPGASRTATAWVRRLSAASTTGGPGCW